jgi:mono/diheme cytochrome c family protein
MLAALAASALLVGVLIWQHHATRTRWTTFLAGDPHAGFQLFQKKDCAHCHSVNGVGGRLAPDLGFAEPPLPSVNELVCAMWNHAPRMWSYMQAEKRAYPTLDREEMADLFAFLYTARYVDEPGDGERGHQLFKTKGCVACHALHGVGGKAGPDLSLVTGQYTPIAWTQAMWNHAPTMEAGMHQLGLPWPKFVGKEMNDLLAYIRENWGGPRREFEVLPADPDRGWKLFQSKSCIVCHSVKGEGGRLGPDLGPNRPLPASIVQFASLMWNHSPDMWRTMKAQGILRPGFEGQQMADLIAFLYSVRNSEPGGSSQLGMSLFASWGCSRCHGAHAEGTRQAPALRGRAETFNLVALAEALWRHGPKMYKKTQELGLPWPALAESEVGDLVVFLNTPLEERR